MKIEELVHCDFHHPTMASMEALNLRDGAAEELANMLQENTSIRALE